MEWQDNRGGGLVRQHKTEAKTALTAFSALRSDTLLAEMHITRQNAKAPVDELLDGEFIRRFCTEPPEALQWAFRQHREVSSFYPEINELVALLRKWKAIQQDRATEAERVEARKRHEEDVAAGRVVDIADVRGMLVETVNRMAMDPEAYKTPRSGDLVPRESVQHTEAEWMDRRAGLLKQVESLKQKRGEAVKGAN